MSRVVIYHSEAFDLVSYGNGLSYALHDNRNKKSLFVQGDDAAKFRRELDSWEANFPEKPYDEIFSAMMSELAA